MTGVNYFFHLRDSSRKRRVWLIDVETILFHHNLDFIPLFEERYDLVLPRENEQTLLPILEYLQTSTFRAMLGSLTGYNARHSGEEVAFQSIRNLG